MESRISFKKGKQKEFLDLVIKRLNCISLKDILQFIPQLSYSSLKNYHTERRLLPKTLFNDLIYLSKININDLDIKYLNNNWGQVKGGRKSKRKK